MAAAQLNAAGGIDVNRGIADQPRGLTESDPRLIYRYSQGFSLRRRLIAVFVPHSNALSLLGVLTLAIAPSALLAAARPSLRPAPLTAAILILAPEMTHTRPLASIVDRIPEVGLGGIVGVLVSSLLMPSSAFRLTRETAAQTLDLMACLLYTSPSPRDRTRSRMPSSA